MFGLRTRNQEAESEYRRFIKGLSDSMFSPLDTNNFGMT